MPRSHRAIKRLHIVAVGLVLAGLFIASLLTSFREPPLVNIGEIKPSMSFSTVRVQGMLEADARQLRDGGVFYQINDGTGCLPIFLAQSSFGKLPVAGSRIIVEGILGLGTGHALRMNVQSADKIFVMPEKFISDFRISDITVEQESESITAYGRVAKVWHPGAGSKAPHRIVLADPSGSLEAIHWFAPKRPVDVGDRLEIHGTVELYKERVQLKVWHSGDICPYSGR